jgi:hypothetical protein
VTKFIFALAMLQIVLCFTSGGKWENTSIGMQRNTRHEENTRTK